jgi:hypothetical protein
MSEEQTPFEWEGKPDSSKTPEIVITPEMIAAGREAFESSSGGDADWVVELIYRAMAAEGAVSRSNRPRSHRQP